MTASAVLLAGSHMRRLPRGLTTPPPGRWKLARSMAPVSCPAWVCSGTWIRMRGSARGAQSQCTPSKRHLNIMAITEHCSGTSTTLADGWCSSLRAKRSGCSPPICEPSSTRITHCCSHPLRSTIPPTFGACPLRPDGGRTPCWTSKKTFTRSWPKSNAPG